MTHEYKGATQRDSMLWVKTFHIIFVMAWMAGLFYLPRILVHYQEGLDANEDVHRLVTMANKLLRFTWVMAVIGTTLGIWLWLGWFFGGGWVLAKLGFVIGLIIYLMICQLLVRRMQSGGSLRLSSLQLRLFNEGGLVLLVPIVLLAVFKPF
tara:strand:- start:17336 stop:17791 length:456 start_codon:yes stop_codon:yes gene_type:complete